MVPSAFVVLDAFPLTPNGKVDRAQLPAPGREETAAGSFVEPATETERAVAAIWADVLGEERVGATDGFLELGGDSISALRVVMRLSDLSEHEVPVAALFEGGTVRAIAALIDGGETIRSGLVVPLRSTGSKPPLFFVHPLGGSVFSYAELVEALPWTSPSTPCRRPSSRGWDVLRPSRAWRASQRSTSTRCARASRRLLTTTAAGAWAARSPTRCPASCRPRARR